MTAAFTVLSFSFAIPQPAHSVTDADAFQQQNQVQHSRLLNREGIFGRRSNNDGSGPDKPGDDGSDDDNGKLPECPKLEPIEKTKERFDHMQELNNQLKELTENSDSDSAESESEFEEVEIPLDYEISDSEEIYDEEFSDSEDTQISLNSMSAGYQSAKSDGYAESVYEYKYKTSPSRLDRFRRREIYANKKEQELFSKARTQDDLTNASKIEIPDKRLKNKLWRHPDTFGFKKPKTSSKTPREDFFKEHGEQAKKQLKDHLISPDTRCFKNGFYREHQELYDYYYNNKTGKLLIVTNNVKTGKQQVFSFWTISKMQRLELFNHKHVHKHWKLIEALQKKEAQEKALFEAQNEQKRE